jgi:DNA-binding transcriptional LysR family regulator
VPTSRQLQILIAIAEAGSIREAADRLDISQPAVSKHVKLLERAVGGELFIRSRGKKAQLSQLGLRIFEDAHRILEIESRISIQRPPPFLEEPCIFVRSFMLDTIKKRLDELYEAGFPRRARFIVVDNSDDITAKVDNNPSSFALLRTDSTLVSRGMMCYIIRSETCSLYVSSSLADDIQNGKMRACDTPLLVPSGSPEILSWLKSFLPGTGFSPDNICLGSPFMDVLLENVKAGDGGAVLMDWYVHDNANTLCKISSTSQKNKEMNVILISGASARQNVLKDIINSIKLVY